MMTADEVVDFFNHKVGERAYVINEEDKIRIFTKDSKWLIFKDYNKCGSKYILYHSSSAKDHKHYHAQMESYNLDFLIFRACIHDYDDLPRGFGNWENFKRSWEYFCLGRDIAESVEKWIFLYES